MEKVEIINELSEFFKVFSDTTRLRILEVLLNEETSVGVIANKINASNSAVSHQLSYLRSTNLVKTRKEGQVITNSLGVKHLVRNASENYISKLYVQRKNDWPVPSRD